jgi:hypothetical protein
LFDGATDDEVLGSGSRWITRRGTPDGAADTRAGAPATIASAAWSASRSAASPGSLTSSLGCAAIASPVSIGAARDCCTV